MSNKRRLTQDEEQVKYNRSFSKDIPLYEVQSFNTTLELSPFYNIAKEEFTKCPSPCVIFKLNQSTGVKIVIKSKNPRRSFSKNNIDPVVKQKLMNRLKING